MIGTWGAVAVTWITVVAGTFCGADTSGLVELGTTALEAAAVITAFYSWKAKNENRLKIAKSMVKEWADEYGIDAVIPLAEIVLKE